MTNEQATETQRPEPWRISEKQIGETLFSCEIIDASGQRVLLYEVESQPGHEALIRIVACVNACAGMPTERLNELLDVGGLAFVHDVYLRRTQVPTEECADQESHGRELEARLERLLAALESLSRAVDQHGICVCGHDSKLTSDDCPLHGVGANKARDALAETQP